MHAYPSNIVHSTAMQYIVSYMRYLFKIHNYETSLGNVTKRALANLYNVSWTSFIHVFTIMLTRGDIYKGSRYLGDNDTKTTWLWNCFNCFYCCYADVHILLYHCSRVLLVLVSVPEWLILHWSSLPLNDWSYIGLLYLWMTNLTLVFSTSEWLILHWSSLPLNDWSNIGLLYLWLTDLTLVFSTSEWLILHWSALPLIDWSYIGLLYLWMTDLTLVFSTSEWLILHWSSLHLNLDMLSK